MRTYAPPDPVAPAVRQLEAERLRPSPDEESAEQKQALMLIELIGLVAHAVECPGCLYCKGVAA